MRLNTLAINVALLCFSPMILLAQGQMPTKAIDPSALLSEEKKEGDHQRAVEFLEWLHYGAGPHNVDNYWQNLWRDVDALEPKNNDAEAVPKDWKLVSPYNGVLGGDGNRYSGRVVDIEPPRPDMGTRVLSASGGLWEYLLFGFGAISDKITTQKGGAFATHPTNKDIILLGTGEPGFPNNPQQHVNSGTGLWKTVNSGKSWVPVAMPSNPGQFYEIMFKPDNPNYVYAATDKGFYRSTNGGNTWVRTFTPIAGANVSDFVIMPGTTNTIVIAVAGDKLYRSTASGAVGSWTPLAGGAPTTNFGRSELAVCPYSPGLIYANTTRLDNGNTLGIFKTTNSGDTWIPCIINGMGSPPEFHRGQGGYDVAIVVKPTDPNIVFAGGVWFLQSTDGLNFSPAPAPYAHDDYHSFEYKPDASVLYIGCDGGLFISTNDGVTASSSANLLPVTEYYHFSIGKSDPLRIGGGTQDNAFMYTRGPSHTWSNNSIGVLFDGSGFDVDPFDGDVIYGVANGVHYKTINGGLNWSAISNGIPPPTLFSFWNSVIVSDWNSPSSQYTEQDGRVYKTTDQGNTWLDISPGGTPFPVDIIEMAVSRGAVPNVYACLWGNKTLQVLDRVSGTWMNRSAGLPTTGTNSTYVRKVIPSNSSNIADTDFAYAIMGGIPGGPVKKVFITTNRGQTWKDITGNLPNVSCIDLVTHPTDYNILILATEIGAFRTDDGGQTWFHWWEGMPRSIPMTEFDFVDSTAINGRLWVYASTMGRGIWKREMGAGFAKQSGFERENSPLFANRTSLGEAEMPAFRLDQNLAHFGDASMTTIPFYVDKEARVQLALFNAGGQLVKTLLDETCSAGMNYRELRLDDLPSGAYFYSMTAPGFRAGKMLLNVH